MARRLRCNGTGSGGTGCPTVHEDLDTGDVIFHGPPLTLADDLGQLQHLLPGEVAVVIPRHAVVDFAPKEMERVARPHQPQQPCWPRALRAIRSWLTPAITLNRWWRDWTDTDAPSELQALIDAVTTGHGIDLNRRF
ncbi:hypothetical protein [Streptomyces sp. NPDC055105]|uniref:hypothetical protein n=1 Tax=Streptomyces sp. NPDC055105 TaxID=3365719 RepID=UPI0037D4920B